jgi:DNA-binding GntR family transcriptional regulator
MVDGTDGSGKTDGRNGTDEAHGVMSLCDHGQVATDRSPVPPGQRVIADLRERIERGEWQADDRLPSVAALADHYGVARRTVTRALQTLAADGLVVIVRSWGTFRT